jgi:hypothetical protein
VQDIGQLPYLPNPSILVSPQGSIWPHRHWFCGGHGNIGEKSDFDFYLAYLDEVAALVNEHVPRPVAGPDLSMTDYLGELGEDARSRLLSELDNHFGLYLYGRQLVAGEKPSQGGGNPFTSGAIGA